MFFSLFSPTVRRQFTESLPKAGGKFAAAGRFFLDSVGKVFY